MFRRFATVMVALSFSFAGGWAQQNPFVGTWKLIPSKSTINDIPRVSQILTLKAYGEGLQSRSELVFEDGRKVITEWSATLDGTPSPLQGDSHYDTVAIKMIDERTLEITSKKGRSVGRSSRWVISPDGKTMTKIQKVVNALGATLDNVIVMEKQ